MPIWAELTAFLTSRNLPTHKLPEYLLTLPELPQGRTGKVCHHTLTELATRECGVLS
jgi:non-ribosomal peptide synthetase component E (peptide arylation enzyme)